MERKEVTYTAEGIESLLASDALTCLGMGTRRVCYALPDGRLCVKCYRNGDEMAEGSDSAENSPGKLRSSVAREIRRNRFSDNGNTSCQEWRQYMSLRKRLPPELMAVFPETMDRLLLPVRGWCVVEDRVLNSDGSSALPFMETYVSVRDAGTRAALLSAIRKLRDMLARHAVCFYDPQNILVQWLADGSFRLRIVDFEPASRTLISLDKMFSALVGLKVRRRFARYLKSFDAAAEERIRAFHLQANPMDSGIPA